MPKYVIIGNSAGGIGAAEAIRQVDREGSLAIISDEPCVAYSRPLISEYLAGEKDFDGMVYRPADFYARNGIETILGNKVVGIDTDNAKVKLADGQEIGYEKLLIATGGVPFVPRTDGGDKEGVVTFTTLADAQQLSKIVETTKTAVVIGGGLIGISVTEALVKRGVAVTIVELKDRILNVILDEQGSQIAEKAVTAAGVKLACNSSVSKIVGRADDDSKVGGVVLADGREIPCDMVVVAIGVIPRLDAVADSNLKRNRGIVVDRAMATSAPNVYACGDVAEAYDYVLDINRLTPIWPNAFIGGRTAGFNMAGRPSEYPGGTGMNSMKYFGLAIVSVGTVMPDANADYEVLGKFDPDAGIYKKVVLRDNKIVGFSFANQIEKTGILSGLIRDKVDVSSFKDQLLSDDFDITVFPKELRKERLGIKPQILAQVELKEQVEEYALE